MSDSRNKEIGIRLSRIRNALKLSQYDMSKEFGVTNSAFSLYERGERPIPMFVLAPLCELYHISTDFLIGTASISSEAFSERLSSILSSSKKTIQSFLAENGLNKDTEPLYLSGCFIPSLNVIQILATYFECSCDYLLGSSTQSSPHTSIEITALIPRANDIDSFEGLDADLRAKAEGYLDSLRDIQKGRNAAKIQEA